MRPGTVTYLPVALTVKCRLLTGGERKCIDNDKAGCEARSECCLNMRTGEWPAVGARLDLQL